MSPAALAVPLVLALGADPVPATAPPAARGPGPFEWIARYRESPRPDLAAEMIWRLDRGGVLDGDRAHLSGFFSELFRRPELQAFRLVNTSQVGPRGRYTLVEALWIAGDGEAASRIARSRGIPDAPFKRRAFDPRRAAPRSSEELAVAWGAYVASGDLAIPRRLLEALDHDPGRAGLRLHLSIRRSLARYAALAKPVEELLRGEARRRRGPSGRIAEGLVAQLDALAQRPGETTMLRRELRVATPGPGGALGEPRLLTVTTAGALLARWELAPDRSGKGGRTVVFVAPDVWDRDDELGVTRMGFAPDATFRFPWLSGEDPGAPRLELDHELEYLKARKAFRERLPDGKGERWAIREGQYLTTLTVDGERPRRLTLETGARTVLEVAYPAAPTTPPLDLALFTPDEPPLFGAPPKGVAARQPSP